jgi:uncharacterized membrane protein YfcA
MTWALVALLGLVAGVVSGLFGVGGAIVIIPGLVLIAKLPQHAAHGTSLAALLLPVGLLGALEYYKRGQVNLAYAAEGVRRVPAADLRQASGVVTLR